MKTIVFCLPGIHFSYRALESWTKLLLACPQYQVNPILKTAFSPNIYHVRNYCLDGDKYGPTTQKPFQGNIDYDYIMWIDSDIVYEPKDFHTLLKAIEKRANTHILSGIYLTQDKKHVAVHKGEKRLTKTETNSLKKITKVDSSGLGFTLIKKGVFESLTYPWFQPLKLIDTDKNYEMFLGEDVSFFYRAKEKGFNTYIHPQVFLGHEKLLVIK